VREEEVRIIFLIFLHCNLHLHDLMSLLALTSASLWLATFLVVLVQRSKFLMEIFPRTQLYIIVYLYDARYDSYKQEFYKICTKEFATKWKSKIDELRKWLLNQL
jgi:hypothetical protein